MKLRQARATIALIAINAVLWVGQILPGSQLTQFLFFAPLLTEAEPWRMLTAGFVHDPSGPMHILLNMYSIFVFGSVLEPMLGKARFIALYLISIFGGSVAVLYLADPFSPVVGASGGFFGLMGAYFVVMRSIGASSTQMVGLIAINLVFGFIIPGISWQGHVGGLLAGGAIASVYANTRKSSQQLSQKLGVLLVLAVFVALTFYRINTWQYAGY
ncbi:rhomboid family intramembrane serine protease [Candidatus Rhodoluna planktonica]|uniref:rhomboid family intramembrane serine protease n=1 Tax=Candidatus Rhodoluna planktonica TaxID=535712 RepID=UPI0008DA020F|nr:rhomboid family intramembrane serine protease [Candidatus Rhodoluna planktonica]